MNLYRAAKKVEKQALRIAGKVLDGRKFESFDPSLLTVGDSPLDEHLDAQSSGQVYFGILCRLAQDKLQDAEIRFKNWHSKVYNKCNEKIKSETGIKRPNKIDVENRIISDYGEKFRLLKKAIMKREYIFDRLNIWYSGWLTKGFSLSDLKSRKPRQINKDRRNLFVRSVKHVEEEEEE